MPATPPPATGRSPILAAALSFLIPGLGQWYNGERAMGVALCCITLGIGGGLWSALRGPATLGAQVTGIALGLVYLFVWMPAVIDAAQQAAGRTTRLLAGTKTWYVILMLLTVGPMAIPLLWQSPVFSRAGKIGWTVFVITIALLFVLTVVVAGPMLDRFLEKNAYLLSPDL